MTIRQFDKTINLSNSGNLQMFFIGVGSAFSKNNYQTNLLLIKGEAHLLVDCGTLFSYAMEKSYNTDICDINNILITHAHADHVGCLEELALIGRYLKKQKLNCYITNEFKNKIWNQTLRGGLELNEGGINYFDDYFNQIEPALLRKKPFEMYATSVGGIDLKLFRTKHIITNGKYFQKSLYSIGMIIDDRILFTSDTQFNKMQLDWILDNYNIEYIFHDCDVSGTAENVHASYSQLKTLPQNIKAKMYLCHYNSAAEKVDSKKDGFAGFAKAGVYYEF